MLLHSLWSLLLFVYALADVSISQPIAGVSFSGLGGTVSFKVSWIDDTDNSDDTLSLSKVSKYLIVLCSGSNSNIKPVKTLSDSVASSARSYDASLLSTDVPNGNYFVQVYAQFANGYTIHYTPRFSLTGMSGQTATLTFAASLLTVAGEDGPDAQLQVGGTPVSINSASFTVPYDLQTGRTKYAPMQIQPGTVVTHTMYSTRYYTSAYTPFTSLSPSPNVYSTITPGWSYAVTSLFNSAAIAEYPTLYYPASQRVIQASLSSARKKRWL
ncbi:cell wall synthesis KRE9KNH1 [Metschnikowia bicuspidata]|uniref:Cell wall synthesis KRE9KNH1 n=1 Tax=Metschnikowia bicuspidata TaxID=27322 RepID=A0A4P9Z7L9_9ASCO|nr:cell wall synthesis KRE9KNH1 [Metschnikowia bicuspidata]